MLRELPPTSGLPPLISDLFGHKPAGRLEAGLAALLDGFEPQVECSGTACLVIALETLKARSPRRSIIVPAFTCPLVVLAATRAGLKVLACDLAPERFDLDPGHLARLVTPDTLCVIATHLGGWLTDVAALRALLPPGVAIIEDAAQAFGARQAGATAGLAGDIGFFSFALGKGFTSYEGGALVTRDPPLRVELRATGQRLASANPLKEFHRCAEYAVFHFLYNPAGLRLIYGPSKNYWLRRGDTIRAIGDYFDGDIALHPVSAWRKGVAAGALKRFAAHLEATHQSRARLLAALAQVPGLELHQPRPGDQPSGIFALVTLPSARQCEAALARLWRTPLGVSKLFAHVLGDYAYLRGKLEPAPTPKARDLAARTLTLTTSPWLREAEIAKIVSGISLGMADRP